MITNEQAEKANDYIRDNAEAYARAKGDRIYLEQYRKTLKAQGMVEYAIEHPKSTGQEREAYAYSTEEYINNLEGLREAVTVEEELRWKMTAAQAKIEMWRTYQANQRSGI